MKISLQIKNIFFIIICFLLPVSDFSNSQAMETGGIVNDGETSPLLSRSSDPVTFTVLRNKGALPSSTLTAGLSNEMLTSAQGGPAVVFHEGGDYDRDLQPLPVTYKEGQPLVDGVDRAKFMRGLDKIIFEKTRSKKVVATGILSGVAGIVPSTPSTGALLYNVGNLVLDGSPPDSAPSDALITWYMVTSTPIFCRQFYEMGQRIMTYLASENSFTPHAGQDDSFPHAYKKWKSHVAVNWGVRVAAALDASFYAGVVFLSQGKEFRNVAWGTAWSVWLSFFERNEAIGTRKVDRVFISYAYDSADVREKRAMLLYQLLKVTLPRLESDDDLVDQIYSIVKNEKKKTAKEDTTRDPDDFDQVERCCATTALFLKSSRPFEQSSAALEDAEDEKGFKHTQTTPGDGGSTTPPQAGDIHVDETQRKEKDKGEEDPKSRKIRELQEVIEVLTLKAAREGSDTKKLTDALIATEQLLKKTENLTAALIQHRALKDKMVASVKEALMEYVSIFCTGAGYFSRLLGRQLVFEAILEQLIGLSPETSSAAAWAGAAAEVLYRTGTEYDVHQEYFKGLLNSFSLKYLVDYKSIRKTANGVSWINGGFVALTGAVAAVLKLRQYAVPTPIQALLVIPGFILDQGSATELSKEKTQNLVTAGLTTQWCGCACGKRCLKSCGKGCSKMSIERKRTWCHYWVLQVVELVKSANAATINKLSAIALDAK